MRSGRLRHRVSIQSTSESTDAFGELTDSWSTDATVWASIEPISGREAQIAKQTNPLVSHRVVMRYRSGMTPKNRILFGSSVYHITEVIDPDQRNISLRLMCIEDVS